MPSVRRAALALASILLAACAEAPPPEPQQPPPMAPPAAFSAAPRELTPLDAEMLKISSAEEQIDRLFPHAGESSKGGGWHKKAGDQKDDKAAPASNGAEDPCAVACRALASMRSSADHLCQLSGDGDGRCDDARARVRGATQRVKSVCPACAVAAQP